MFRFEDAPKNPSIYRSMPRCWSVVCELGMNGSKIVDALLAEEVKRQYWAR
jgi:hypothetical protein